MKRIYLFMLFVLAAVACQEDVVMQDISYSGEMNFNILAPGEQTKVSGDSFEASDMIGLYVTDYIDEKTAMPLQISGNRANNVPATYGGTSWAPDKPIYWGEGKSDVYAYYPYIEEVADVESLYFSVAADQTGEGYEDSDFLWAKAEGVSQTEGTVDLPMRHVMSKLIVKIVAGEDYIGSLPEDASVLLHSTVTNARIDLSKGAVSKDPYSGAESIKMKNLGVRTSGGVDAVVYEAIVVPQMLEASVPLLEINSKSVSYLVEDPFNFRPGVSYTYTVTLNTSTMAIKVEIGCELEDWNSSGGGSGDSGEGGEGSGDESDDSDLSGYTDLSSAGTANCYQVRGSGNYRFKAAIGNTEATVGNVKSVEVLWESFGTDVMPNVGDLIATASYKNGYICFSTPDTFKEGNAVIAAKNSKGTILWSWHIWCETDELGEHEYYNDAGIMMDRNLGATSVSPGDIRTLGLNYQWGRKDPFLSQGAFTSSAPAASTGTWYEKPDGSLSAAESNPTTAYSGLYLDGAAWDSEKTVYDPCPQGWRVPDGGKDGVWATALGTSYEFTPDTDNPSALFSSSNGIFYPGLRYWSVTSLDVHEASCLFFGAFIIPSYSHLKTGGLFVRCYKE